MTAAQSATVLVSAPAPAMDHAGMANAIRFLAADAVQQANSGHPGMPMGMADAEAALVSGLRLSMPS